MPCIYALSAEEVASVGEREEGMPVSDSASQLQTAELLLDELDRRKYVQILGDNGVGKSHLLSQVTTLLDQRGTSYQKIVGNDHGAALHVLQNSAPRSLVVVDALESADQSVLRALGEHISRDGGVISALNSANADSSFAVSLAPFLSEYPEAATVHDRIYRFRLQPLTDFEMERFIHRHLNATFDAHTLFMLRKLSWGRPGWARDLMILAEAGQISDDPRPVINKLQLRDYSLPALNSVAASVGSLAPSVAAAAVVLSEIDPVDHTQARDLVGDDAVRVLQARGVLLTYESTGLVTAPALIAAAVHSQVSPSELTSLRQHVGSQMILQESLGLPLSLNDSLFCARAYSHSDSDSVPAQQPLLNLLLRTADETLEFVNNGNIRALVLRLAKQDVRFSDLFGARTMTVIGGPQQGLAKLTSVAETNDRNEQLGESFLQAVLTAETTAPFSSEVDPLPQATQKSTAEEVFSLWNSVSPLGQEMSFLYRTMQGEQDLPVQLAAAALYKHELLWRGHRLTDVDHAWFRWLLRRSLLSDASNLRDIIDTAFVSYACTMLLADDYVERYEELHWLISDLRALPFHRRWIAHLASAATALASGQASRAAVEWGLFQERVPRFLPWRLRTRLKLFGEALQDAAKGAAPRNYDAWSAIQLVPYLTGTDDVLPPPPSVPHELTVVPIVPLMYRNLAASEHQNPIELQQVAEQLAELRLGAPALRAFTEARRILVRRRSTGAVVRCDEQIERLKESLFSRVPWLSTNDLPGIPQEKLTPKKHSAAQLAAEGLSNHEVAQSLQCSVRTVESHLSQARAKLGIARRQDFAEHPILAGASANSR